MSETGNQELSRRANAAPAAFFVRPRPDRPHADGRADEFDTGPCRLFVKLESQNPGGSIKDRIALSMIEAAEKDGRLKPGGTIVEATAGNTGLGLAQVGIPKGYRIMLVVPDKMAREKIQHLRALGAEVRLTRSDVGKGHPEYYQDMAERIAAETPARSTSTSSPTRRTRWPTRRRPGRRSVEQLERRRRRGGGRRRLGRHADRARPLLRRRSRRRPRWCWPTRSARCWRRWSRPAR